MHIRATMKRVVVASLRAGTRRLGTRRMVRVLQRGMADDDLRVVLAHLLNKQDLVIEVERNGQRWCVPTGDEIFTEIFRTGGYQEDDVVAVDTWIASHLARDGADTVIDVGANIGTTTCPLARRGHRVVAVEPVPTTFAILERNVALKGLGDRVITAPVAIAQDRESVELITTLGSGCSEVALTDHSPAFAQWGLAPTGSVTVAAETLDHLIDRLDVAPSRVRYVWSDTQGSEGDVITTGSSLWSDGVPLYIEVWPAALDRRYGIEEFVALVEANFSSFLGKDRLAGRAAAKPRPIGELRDFIDRIDRWTDALLIP